MEYKDYYLRNDRELGELPESTAPSDKCYVCDKKIRNRKQFFMQSIRNRAPSGFDPGNPGIPIIEIEYWVCKEGFGCANE